MRATKPTHHVLPGATSRFSTQVRQAFLLVLVGFALLSAMLFSNTADAAIPNYELEFLGVGSPAAINNEGTVIGASLVGGAYVPLVSENGTSWTTLPVPTGAINTFPTDVNNSGVIVGVSFSVPGNARAVRWTKSVGVYTVEFLPRLTGDNNSYATGINDLGQIVGARSSLGYVPTGTGWLYSDAGGIVDLAATYGLWAYPTELNETGEVLAGTAVLDLGSGTYRIPPGQPSNYQGVVGVDINNAGFIAGEATLRSTSLNVRSVFRFEGDLAGWRYLSGTSKYTVAASINNIGDVGYGELGAGIYFDGMGTFALFELLDPDVVAAGWTVTGSYPEINDSRIIAVVGRNNLTGAVGAVRLVPNGDLQPPSAPVSLVGVASYASRQKPWNSIDLTWTNTSSQTKRYVLERSVSGLNDWSEINMIAPYTATSFSDATVGVGVTYDYRVAAVGLAGNSAWSNIATVTAPLTPLDTTDPIVNFITPASGDTVAGTVQLVAEASDDVAVEYFEIRYWNQYLGQEIVLGSKPGGGTLTVNWNTNALTPATYSVSAYAYDTMGNWTTETIPLNVRSLATSMVVDDITLKSTIRLRIVLIGGTVLVKDDLGRLVPGALVTAKWTQPSGAVKQVNAYTNSFGKASFSTSGGRGTYTLTILNAERTGLVFDSANSVMSKSITK